MQGFCGQRKLISAAAASHLTQLAQTVFPLLSLLPPPYRTSIRPFEHHQRRRSHISINLTTNTRWPCHWTFLRQTSTIYHIAQCRSPSSFPSRPCIGHRRHLSSQAIVVTNNSAIVTHSTCLRLHCHLGPPSALFKATTPLQGSATMDSRTQRIVGGALASTMLHP